MTPKTVPAIRQPRPRKRRSAGGVAHCFTDGPAELAAYLACPQASYVTGECWYIDGGLHLWGDSWSIPDGDEQLPPAIAALKNQ